MNKLIAVVGASGVGKTALVQALAKAHPPVLSPVEGFATAYEQHAERPFQFHGFTRLASISLSASFHSRGLLAEPEFDLCRRVYNFLRALMPRPELIVRLQADDITVASRLSRRDRINIATAEDTALFNAFLDEWLAGIPSENLLQLDVSNEDIDYSKSVGIIRRRL